MELWTAPPPTSADALTTLLAALQEADDAAALARAVCTWLPCLAPHTWGALVLPTGYGSWRWATGADQPVEPITLSPSEAVLARMQAPLFGTSYRSAEPWIRALLALFPHATGRYVLLPMQCGEVRALLCLGTERAGRWAKAERQALIHGAGAVQLALRNVTLTSQIRQVKQSTHLFNDVQYAIAHTLDIKELATQVVEQVARCYGYSLVSLYVLEDDELHCQHQVGYPHILWRLPASAGIMARAVRERRSIWVEDVAATPEFIAALPDISSEIAIPLHCGAHVYGVLNIEAPGPHALSQHDLATLEAVGAEVSVAIERALLHSATHRQAQQLTVIERLRVAIGSQLDTQALGATIVRSLHDVLHLESVSLFTLVNHTLRLRAHLGSFDLPRTTYSVDEGLTGLCIRKQVPLLINNVQQEVAYICTDARIYSGMYVPLLYGEHVLGALTIEAATLLSTDDFAVVTALSEQIAAALEQSHRLEVAQAAQAREAFLNQLLTTLNHAQPDEWTAVWSRLTQQLGVMLVSDHCAICIFDVQQIERVVSWSAYNGTAIQDILHLMPKSSINQYALDHLDQGQTIHIPNLYESPFPQSCFRQALLAHNIRSMAAVPVLVDGVLAAAIAVFREQPWQCEPSELMLLEQVAQHLAVALRQTQLHAQERQRRHELELARQIALEINAHHDLQPMLEAIVERACGLLNADVAALYLVQPDGMVAELRVAFNLPSSLIGSRLSPEQGLVGKTLSMLRSYLVPNYATWAFRDPTFHSVPLGATLGVPLIARERAIGVLCVGHIGTAKEFQATDQRLLELLAAQVAQAIEMAQLLEDVRRRTVELEAVYANALALTAQQELTPVLESIVERGMALLDASAGGLHLLDQQTQELEVTIGMHLPPGVLGTRAKVGEGIVGQVAQTRQSIRIDNYQAYSSDDEIYAALPWQAVLCVPLLSGEQILGAIVIVHQALGKRFSERDQQTLELFATQAAQAIEHARRFERERMLRADAEGSLSEMQAVLHELEHTNERIGRIEKFRMLGELASEVAHDFNNALVSILGNTQFLLLDENDPERIAMLRSVEAAARDSVSMVKRIQEFGRTQQVAHTEIVNINTLMRDAVLMTQSRWRSVAEPILSLDATVAVRGSATELRRVLMNLIVNALDAMAQGGMLRLETCDVGQMVCITVADTGTGMPPDVQDRIFDPFFTTKALGMGTGLGLSICQQIITRHGGTITVESTPGAGTTFLIHLPATEETPRPALAHPARLR